MQSLKYRVFAPIVSILPLKFWLVSFYVIRFKRLPNLNNPQSFNEKILWRKLNDRDDVYTKLADKLISKNIVSTILPTVRVPTTYWSGDSLDSLDLNKIPGKFMYKANHASGTNLFVDQSVRPVTNKVLDELRVIWFAHDQYGSLGEWAYLNIPKKVFLEEYLDFCGKSPDDFKFFVFDGKVRYVQVDTDRFDEHKRNMYDSDWNDLGINYSHPMGCKYPVKPKFISEMIDIAEKLSMGLDFIRIDLYWFDEDIWFGEYTIYPGAGYEVFPSYKNDLEFGRYWRVTRGC